MKATDLMIGDWVYYDMKALSCLKPVTLREAHQLSKLDFAIFQDDEDYTKPIPLTEDILRANGMSKTDNHNEECYVNFFRDDNRYGVRVEYSFPTDEDMLNVKICGYVLPKQILYVHELQHALRLCGLNELADNFKLCTRK